MPLEAVMICLDNSQWMRNGDFCPTRLQAQSEAVSSIADLKIKSNLETKVGVLSMAGHRIEVHVSPTRDIGKIMNSIGKSIQPYGKCNFIGGMKTAQLALKKRVNKNQQQRIIVFVGSPVEDDIKELEKLGKQLKKNSVVVDIINFGVENETNENKPKLEAFRNAVNSSADNSHLINVPAAPNIVLLGALHNTPIMLDNASSYSTSGGVQPQTDIGNSTTDDITQQDRQMQMVIRLSMETERKRQEEEKKKKEEEKKKVAENKTMEPVQENPAEEDEGDEGDEGDDELDMARAVKMSLGLSGVDEKTEEAKDKVDEDKQVAGTDEILNDQDFLKEIMGDIGLDPSEVDEVIKKTAEMDDQGDMVDEDHKEKDDKKDKES